jgi:Reverse transcriptase (RNA-dependent DNA polymerase)/Type II intron maturase
MDVTQIFEKYKNLMENENIKIFNILNKLKERSEKDLKGKFNNLLSIIAHPNRLLAAYRTIRKNEGATTSVYYFPKSTMCNLSEDEQFWIKESYRAPDGLSLDLIDWISTSIKTNKYKWGINRRIWIPKPGTKKERPLTIPPFTDRLVQEAIRMVLEPIYEPLFMKLNCSFGFRAGFGCHNNLTEISTSSNTQAFNIAIEGDIDGAYPNVRNEILLKILRKKIVDNRFIRFMRNRFKVTLFDTKDKKYKENADFIGIPQGGIDSPLLFNIYLHEMDEFINNDIQKYIEEENIKRNIKNKKEPNKKDKRYLTLVNERDKLKLRMKALRKGLKDYKKNLKINKDIEDKRIIQVLKNNEKTSKRIRFYTSQYIKPPKKNLTPTKWSSLIHNPILQTKEMFSYRDTAKKIFHKMKQVRSIDPNKLRIKLFYTRYADDFIILGNFTQEMAIIIKQKLKNWLWNEREAILSEEKTKITDIRKTSARFLGFEIRAKDKKHLKKVTVKKTGLTFTRRMITGLYIIPDRQRLINRMHMKGYCDKKGFPKSLPWLTSLETHIIIMRFNAVMDGLARYYVDYTTFKWAISRWLYILKWSCFHTIAHKHNTSIRKMLKRYGQPTKKKPKRIIKFNSKKIRRKYTTHRDITASFTMKYKNEKGEEIERIKSWTLLTEKQCIDKNKVGNDTLLRFISKSIKNNTYKGNIPGKGRTPRIYDMNFLDEINRVNFRTQAQFDLPCAKCGRTDKIEMHHIKHVKKNKFSTIPDTENYRKVMGIRNRKQIPLCVNCHNEIHASRYSGTSLSKIKLPNITLLYDNRIVSPENHINKKNMPYYSAPLETYLDLKGWKKIIREKKDIKDIKSKKIKKDIKDIKD